MDGVVSGVPGDAEVGTVPAVLNDVEVATLPALPPDAASPRRLSHRTGEPRRPGILIAAIVAAWTSVAVTIVAFAWWWWNAAHITTFPTSARLVAWFNPDPVSATAIILVIAVGLVALLMVAAAGAVAYNAWAGHRWIRVGALVCLAVTATSYLATWWFTAAMCPLAVAAVLLWFPPAKRFFADMDDYHHVEPVVVPSVGVRYGPQPLIGRR